MSHIFEPPLHRQSNLTVHGKSASFWDRNELDYFGVFFKYVDFNTFFHQAPEPIPEKYQTWLATTNPAQCPDRQVWHIIEKITELHNLHIPFIPSETQSLINQLAAALFDYFDYVSPGERACRRNIKFPFVMCGDTYDAEMDSIIFDADINYVLMGFQQDSRLLKSQLIPLAISAFVKNNLTRSKTSAPLAEMLIPFITMCGTTPTFYLIPITQNFVNDVAAGKSPDYETVVLVYEPIPRDSPFVGSGLAFPDSRIPATRAFLAFKQFLNGEGESAFSVDPELHTIHPGDRIL